MFKFLMLTIFAVSGIANAGEIQVSRTDCYNNSGVKPLTLCQSFFRDLVETKKKQVSLTIQQSNIKPESGDEFYTHSYRAAKELLSKKNIEHRLVFSWQDKPFEDVDLSIQSSYTREYMGRDASCQIAIIASFRQEMYYQTILVEKLHHETWTKDEEANCYLRGQDLLKSAIEDIL